MRLHQQTLLSGTLVLLLTEEFMRDHYFGQDSSLGRNTFGSN